MPSPLEVLYQATSEPLGLRISTDGDFQRMAQRLYQARAKERKEGRGEELDYLQFRRSSNPEELWIVNSKPQEKTDGTAQS